jgi:transcription elongation GreA/GreB family factor
VFGDYIDLDGGQISIASPLGRTLLGKRAGDQVNLQLPRGERKLQIKSVITLPQMVDAGPSE